MTFPTIEVQLNREYMMQLRQALLMQLDAIERLLHISPTTAELRRAVKERGKMEASDKQPEKKMES